MGPCEEHTVQAKRSNKLTAPSMCHAALVPNDCSSTAVDSPETGQPVVSFVSLPMWWVGTLLNVASELLNLAALGYAPATLVTPLGCLTVVFNAIVSSLLLNEPFFRRDLLGFCLIIGGVVCIVWSELGEPVPHRIQTPTVLASDCCDAPPWQAS